MKVPSKFERFFWNHLTEILSFVIVVPIVLWWCNGCSTAWLEHKPSEEERQAIRDSIRKEDEKTKKMLEKTKYHEIDEFEFFDIDTPYDTIHINVKKYAHGNEYDAVPDIVVKRWSKHNGDKEKCRKQFIETEHALYGIKKDQEDFISEIKFTDDTVHLAGPCFYAYYRTESFANRMTTKLKDCGVKQIRFYYSDHIGQNWIETRTLTDNNFISTKRPCVIE